MSMSQPETSFLLRYHPVTLLDAGCGTGRIAIELASHGIDVVGIDHSPDMLQTARAAAPQLDWRLGDLATVQLDRQFSVVLLAGNVITFLTRGTEAAILNNMALHLAPDGLLITAFQLSMDRSRITLEEYDQLATAADLNLSERYSSWDRHPWRWDSPFVVSVHRPR